MKNPYDMLKIPYGATESEIKKSFRKLIKTVHPDLNPQRPDLIDSFIEIYEAYSILKDPVLRRKLDESIASNQYEDFYSNESKIHATDLNDKNAVLYTIKRNVDLIKSDEKIYKKEALKRMFIGGAWISGGILISYLSYINAEATGSGSYVYFTGLVIFGIIQFLNALYCHIAIGVESKKLQKEMWREFNELYHSDKDEKNEYASNVTLTKSNNSKKSVIVYGLFLTVIVLLVVAFINNSEFPRNNLPNEPAKKNSSSQDKSDNSVEKTKKNEYILNGSEIDKMVSKINYDRAFTYTSSTYKGDDLSKLSKAFSSRGYKTVPVTSNNNRNLIASIAHYQEINGLTVDGMAGPKTMGQIGIELAEDKHMNMINYSIKESNHNVRYGWNSDKIETFIYFVAYEFDDDNDMQNGYYLYAYEVDVSSGRISEMEGDILEKYINLGFIGEE